MIHVCITQITSKMKKNTSVITIFCFITLSLITLESKGNIIMTLEESWVCDVKKSCLDCLRLTLCSWCGKENRCYSKKNPVYDGYCSNNTIEHTDFGFSLDENAKCACAGGELERHCHPPEVTDGEECSGRGQCVCGRCVCHTYPEYPTKVVMGEFCEYDNFSCDGICNEGPYQLYNRNQPRNIFDNVEYADIPPATDK